MWYIRFPGGTSGKEPACQCRKHKRLRFDLWVREIPCRRKWHPTPVFLPGEFHGQRSLAVYSPQGCTESEHDWSDLAHSLARPSLWFGRSGNTQFLKKKTNGVECYYMIYKNRHVNFSLALLIFCIIVINFCTLSHPWILSINPIWWQ